MSARLRALGETPSTASTGPSAVRARKRHPSQSVSLRPMRFAESQCRRYLLRRIPRGTPHPTPGRPGALPLPLRRSSTGRRRDTPTPGWRRSAGGLGRVDLQEFLLLPLEFGVSARAPGDQQTVDRRSLQQAQSRRIVPVCDRFANRRVGRQASWPRRAAPLPAALPASARGSRYRALRSTTAQRASRKD